MSQQKPRERLEAGTQVHAEFWEKDGKDSVGEGQKGRGGGAFTHVPCLHDALHLYKHKATGAYCWLVMHPRQHTGGFVALYAIRVRTDGAQWLSSQDERTIMV